jgi:hypothetical protein
VPYKINRCIINGGTAIRPSKLVPLTSKYLPCMQIMRLISRPKFQYWGNFAVFSLIPYRAGFVSFHIYATEHFGVNIATRENKMDGELSHGLDSCYRDTCNLLCSALDVCLRATSSRNCDLARWSDSTSVFKKHILYVGIMADNGGLQ